MLVCVCVYIHVCLHMVGHAYDHQQREEKVSVSWRTTTCSEQSTITLKGQALEEVRSFSYSNNKGGQNGKVEKEVAVRVEIVTVYQMWRQKVFKRHSTYISKYTKL